MLAGGAGDSVIVISDMTVSLLREMSINDVNTLGAKRYIVRRLVFIESHGIAFETAGGAYVANFVMYAATGFYIPQKL